MADFSISAELKANASQFVSELKKGETSVNNFGGVVEKILGPKGKLVLALAAATTAAVKFGQAMNSSMSEIAKGTGKTGEELYKLRENVHDALVDGVARSAKEVGTMIADLNTRFGVTGKEVVQLTKDFDKFAKVTDTDTKTAINLTADAMAKWNIQTEDTDKLLDQLTKASQESGASVTELLNGLKSGQAVFSQFGMSATDTIAFMGALKQNGIESSQALIAMKTALANFANDGINAQEGFAQVSEAIKNATSQTEALSIATATFGARNGAEMVKVLQSGALSADEFKNKLMEAGGAVESTHKAARTSKEAIAELGSALSGTFGGLAEGLESLFKGIVDVIKRAIQMIDPIVRPLMNIVRDVLSFVGELVAEIANLIGDSVENGLGFNMVASSLQSAYETIHDILANLLEVFKNAFSLISHVMGGQWDVVLLDFEKGFLLFAKTILDYVSDLLNGFKGQINVFIEKVINPFIEKVNFVEEKLGRKKTDKMSLIENFDLSGTTGLTQKIDEITKKIQDKTGETAKKMTGDLGAVKKAVKDTGDEAEKEADKVTKHTLQVTQNLKKGMKNALNNIGVDYANLEDDTEKLNMLLENTGAIITNQVAGSFKTFFTQLGEELVNGGLSWQSMTSVILQSISETLSALGSELTALAAVSLVTEQYHKAAIAAAGAAAAFTASGVVAGIANKMKDVTKATSAANMSLKQFYKNLEELSNVSSLDEYASSLGKLKKKYTEISDALQNTSDMIKGVEVARKISAAQFAAENYKYDWYRKENYAKLDYSSYYDSTIQGKLNKAYKESLKLLDDLSESERAVAEYWIEHNSRLNKSGSNLKDYYKSLVKLGQQYIQELTAIQDKLNTFNADTIATLKAQQEELEYSAFIYDYIYSQISSWGEGIDFKSQYSVLYNQLLVNIKNVGLNLKKELLNIGTSVGDSLIDGIIDGAEKTDFLSSLKSVVRENVLKLAVYTESMQEELANASTELISAISMGDSVLLSRARTNFESIWDSAKQAATDAENFINEVFGDIQDGIEDVTDEIKEMGSSISESLVSGLTEGLTEADFMETMKNYIKGMVVNAVVYTEALQAEIAAIGEAISKGIQEGFTDTGLHEIRRDLSYIFNQANNAVSSIDSVLSSVFTGYATGTDNATAGLHLVGEAGPELVRFRGGEQVFNANETKDILNGAGGNNFNVTFNNMQDTSAYAMLQQMKQWQREIAINGII